MSAFRLCALMLTSCTTGDVRVAFPCLAPLLCTTLQRELSDLRAVVLGLRELGWRVNCVLGHSKGEKRATGNWSLYRHSCQGWNALLEAPWFNRGGILTGKTAYMYGQKGGGLV